jgi:multidrug efflux pump subunit AcrA (membrane-fusion protein)
VDTVLVKNNRINYLKKYWYLVIILVLLLVFGLVGYSIGGATYVADKRDIRTAAVEQGKFDVSVRSNGILVTKVTYSVVSEVQGRVEAVFVKPGDVVEKGSVLVRLTNPELAQDIDKLRWELQLVEAETDSELKQSESQVLDQDAVHLSARLLLKGSELKLAAETRLREQNRSAISELDYQRTMFEVEDQRTRSDIEKQRLAKMRENIEHQKKVHQARKEQLKKDIERVQRQIAALEVKSSSSGVVQHINLELGKLLIIGDEVARVADTAQLLAELKVQELQVLNITRGQEAEINTRHNVIKGKVLRVAPTVVSGMVQVDVELQGNLPAEARPDMNVEGSIRIDSIDSTVFVARPAYAQRDSTMGVYLLNKDSSAAHRVPVRFGQVTATQVQILDGLKPGDRIIVSDSTSFEHHEKILLN